MRSASYPRLTAAVHRVRAGVARVARAMVRVAVRAVLPRAGADGERPLTDYKAPNLWLDYRAGFVRRGLPGALLRRAAGGPPSYRQAETAAVASSRAAALAVVPMALRVAGRAPGRLPGAVAAALVLLSPLTVSLLLGDVGRYDAAGALALAVLAGARALRRLPLPVAVAATAVAVASATASEEFLLAVLTPAALAAVTRLAEGRSLPAGARAAMLGGVLGPGAVVAAASLIVPAPRGALAAARAEAAAAGVAPPGPMGDSLAALDRGLVENLAFFRLFEPDAVALSLLLWAGLYAATAAALGRVLGAGRPYRLLVAGHAAIGTALSAAGADFRRWWGLALLGLVGTTGLADGVRAERPVRHRDVTAAAALALTARMLRGMDVHPWGPVRRSPAVSAAPGTG